MGLSALDSALSGLRVAQQQMSVLSNNISNVNTEGYTRKILPQEALTADAVTIGVKGGTIMRSVDLQLERDFWTQISSTNFYDVQAQYLDQIQEFHGPPDQELSIAAAVSDLRDNFLALSTVPDDLFSQQTTVNQAQFLAKKINDFAQLITQLRNDAQDQIEAGVNKINSLLEQIADLNRQISINNNSGKTTAALEDQRDMATKELANEMEVDFFIRGDGIMAIQTTGGVELAAETAKPLFFSPRPLGAQNYYPASAAGIYTGGDPDLVPGARDITSSALNGNIGGLLELRDSVLPQHLAQLDELAHKLSTRFEEQGLRLFTDASGQVPADITTDITSNDLVTLAGGGPLSTAGGAPYTGGVDDVFSMVLDPESAVPRTMNISLTQAETNFPSPPAANAAESLVEEMKRQISNLPPPYNETEVRLNGSGEIEVDSTYDVEFDADGAGQMGAAGLIYLGFTPGITRAAPSDDPLRTVPYLGFSLEFRVNRAIIENPALLQQGTLPGLNVQEGSNEFLRRIAEFAFGDATRQEVNGNVDLTTPGTLQNNLGLNPQAVMVGDVDLVSLGAGGSLVNASGNPFLPPGGPPLLDSFSLRFDEGGVNDTGPIEINLSAAEAFSGLFNGAEQLVDYINNNVIPGLGAPLNGQINASLNEFGQLVIDSQVDVKIGDGTAFPQGMGDEGLSFLGLTAGTTAIEYPSFEIQIGEDNPYTVTIEPGEDENDLLTKLNNIPGVIATVSEATGALNIRPGPGYGGDIRVNAGPVLSAGGDTTLEALFGTANPVVNIGHKTFHEKNLGANGGQTTKIVGVDSLIDYSQKMISIQSETALDVTRRSEDEKTFKDILENRFLDETTVNLDEEMSTLILVQNAFSASARTIQAIEEMFDDLFAAF